MPVQVWGAVHAVNAALSRLHSKVPASVDEKSKVALFWFTVPVRPPVRAVFGAAVSTVHRRSAGERSLLPAPSTARTWNRCAPCARPGYDTPDVHTVKIALSSEHAKPAPASLENANVAVVWTT